MLLPPPPIPPVRGPNDAADPEEGVMTLGVKVMVTLGVPLLDVLTPLLM